MLGHIFTVNEVSAYLRVHRSTVYRLLKAGSIPAFRIGSDWRFDQQTIDTWRRSLEGDPIVPTSSGAS